MTYRLTTLPRHIAAFEGDDLAGHILWKYHHGNIHIDLIWVRPGHAGVLALLMIQFRRLLAPAIVRFEASNDNGPMMRLARLLGAVDRGGFYEFRLRCAGQRDGSSTAGRSKFDAGSGI